MSKAVFLSYASDDAAAAQRIALALREAGITVWFDKDELRGGDAWDASIRKQIRDCTLFVPVISINTEAREEGYFRREWNLAIERTLDMLEGKPFLVPIVIDEIPQKDAKVPAKFQAVQWTRLPHGELSPAFVAHVRELLQPVERTPAPASRTGADASIAGTQSTVGRHPFAFGLLAIAALAVAIGAWFIFGEKGLHGESAPTTSQAELVPEKSIAVLPFLDNSEKKDQEYFSDGLADELLHLLSRIPNLRVAARTSAFSFKGKPDDIQTIARKLVVAYVLEGSVRRAGNMMRISVQLVRAANGYEMWSQTYERKVDDIFKIQDEIASAVAHELKASFGNGSMPATVKTSNNEAYFLFLKAKQELIREGNWEKSAGKFREITQLDPTFAPAWGWFSAMLETQAERGLLEGDKPWEDARAAARKAISLDPQESSGHAALGNLLMEHDRNFKEAGAEFARARALDPNDWSTVVYCALLDRYLGNFDEAIETIRHFLTVDPLNGLAYGLLASTALKAERLDEAQAANERVKSIFPGDRVFFYPIDGSIKFARGQYAEGLAEFERLSPDAPGESFFRLWGEVVANAALGKKVESDAALARLEKLFPGKFLCDKASAHAYRGEADRAMLLLDEAFESRDFSCLVDLKGDPDFKNLWADPRYQELLRKLNLS